MRREQMPDASFSSFYEKKDTLKKKKNTTSKILSYPCFTDLFCVSKSLSLKCHHPRPLTASKYQVVIKLSHSLTKMCQKRGKSEKEKKCQLSQPLLFLQQLQASLVHLLKLGSVLAALLIKDFFIYLSGRGEGGREKMPFEFFLAR